MEMKRRMVVMVAALTIAPLQASPQVQELRPDRVDLLRERGDKAAFEEPSEHYRGPDRWRALEAAVAIGGEAGLVLLAEVLEPGEVAAIVNGANSHTSARTLKRLRNIIAAQGPHSSYSDREALARAWGAAFYRMNKPHPIDAALKQARDTSREPLDRALALGVLCQLGRSERPERAGAIAAYRPFLSDESPELQLAAVEVNGALWDSEVVDTLKRLAFGDDPTVRLVAYYLVARYLRYGTDRPAMGDSTLSQAWQAKHMMPFDPEGLAEWKSREKEWSLRQQELLAAEGVPASPSHFPPAIRPAAP